MDPAPSTALPSRGRGTSLRVLHINKFYSPHIGGVERALQTLLEGLLRHSSVLPRALVCQPRGPRAEATLNGIAVVRAASYGILRSMPLSLTFASEMRREAAAADLVHVHLPFPLADVACLVRGLGDRPLVASFHCDIYRQKVGKIFHLPWAHALLRRATRILVSSPQLRDHSSLLAPYHRKCCLVPYGIEIAEPKEAPRPPDSPPFILFVGRLVPYKGVDVLLRAMRQVPAKLVIIGQGPLRAPLEQQARTLGVADRTRFLGSVADDILRDFYRRCSVLTLPSASPSEAFGLVQLEAMNHGKPVVNTRLPTGVPYASVHEETGLTVTPGNSDELAAALNLLITDRDLYQRLSRAAPERVARHFSLKQMVENVVDVYQSVLAHHAGTSPSASPSLRFPLG